MTATSIAGLDAEARNLVTTIAEVGAKPHTFEELWPATEAALAEAEQVFHRSDPRLAFNPTPLPEERWRRHQAAIGAALAANRKAVVDSERGRIKAQCEGGLSEADKPRRVGELRAAILKAAAKRELAVREVEGAEFMPRPIHPELAIFQRGDIERLAR